MKFLYRPGSEDQRGVRCTIFGGNALVAEVRELDYGKMSLLLVDGLFSDLQDKLLVLVELGCVIATLPTGPGQLHFEVQKNYNFNCFREDFPVIIKGWFNKVGEVTYS